LVGVLEALNEVIPEFLSQGYVVELGKVGNLRIGFSSEGVDKPENFRKSHIKKVRNIHAFFLNIITMLKTHKINAQKIL